jgi:hypothetical protein
MKTITEIIGGAQGLPGISFDSRDVFEEYLTDEYKAFPQTLRVPEGAQPPIAGGYAGTGRVPCQYRPFVRCARAECFFRISTATELIVRLKNDPNLRLLCGFKKVPGRPAFSRNFTALSGTALMGETPDALVKDAHRGRTVYHIPVDSTATEAREKAEKKPRKEEKKEKKAARKA